MPFEREKYPEDWEKLSQWVRFERAGGRCEGSPAFPYCRAVHGLPHPATGSVVVLTVAHLDHDPGNSAPENLRAMCQRCHLTYDAELHARHAAETRRQRQLDAGQMQMWGEECDVGVYSE